MPQLHVDYHEQGYLRRRSSSARATSRTTSTSPRRRRSGVAQYGDANAESFDAEGLVYSTRERFDYLYPGYGKVLPVYHGAVGMLAGEKAATARAGLAIDVNDVYTLTLEERAYHHWVLSLSNLRATAANRKRSARALPRLLRHAGLRRRARDEGVRHPSDE